MNDYIVNVIGTILRHGAPKKMTSVHTLKVRARTPEEAAKAAEEHIIKTNGPLDVLVIEQSAIYDLSDMVTITVDA